VDEPALVHDPTSASHRTIVNIAGARVTKRTHGKLDSRRAQRRRGGAVSARLPWNVRCSEAEQESEQTMTEVTRWDDLRRFTEELQLKLHLAEMDARDRWRELEPQLIELEHKIADAGGTAGDAVTHELTGLGAGLRHLGGDLVLRLRGNYMKGW
jgi:hypothetical protein